MKKLLVTFITGLIVACFCLLLPVIVDLGPSETPLGNLSNTSGANVVTPFTTEGTATTSISADKAAYTITATTTSDADPVIIGPNRQKMLQDGESLVMQFTVVSKTFTGNQNGMLLARRDGIPTSYPSSSAGSVAWYHNGAGGYTTTANNASSYTKAGATDSKGITNANVSAATIFAAGNEVKAVFTPAQSETELGVFEISYRPAGTKEWISGVRASDLPTTVSRDAQIWFYFNGEGTSTLTIKDYSITTTHGANLLYSQDGKEAENANNCGTYVYDEIGMAFVYQTSSYSVTPASMKSWAVTDEATSMSYFGPGKAVLLEEKEALVLEFDVVDASISCDFGFYLSFWAVTNNPSGENGARGLWLHTNVNAATQCSGALKTASSTHSYNVAGANNIVKKGNSVKIVYTPYQDENNLGSFVVYRKQPSDTDFTEAMWVKGMGTEAVRSWENAGSQGAYIRLMWQSGTPSFTLTNYREYTISTETQAVTGIDFDARYSTQSFTNTVSSYAITLTEGNIAVETTAVPEYSLTFGGLYFGRGVTDYVAYVKQGGSYTLPVKPYGIDGHFIHWSTSMGIKQGGAVVTPTGNINVTPVGIHFNMNSTAVNTYGAYGLQFGTLIDYDEYVALNSHNEENDITTGTIIVPASYVGTVALTLDALETSGKTYLNIVNDGFANAASVASGGDYEFYGAIVNILDKNLARDFVAVGYMSFEVGEYSYTLYTEVSEETSIYEVAKSAYATAEGEVKTKIAELYLDRVVEITDGAIVTADGYTSPYTIEGGKLVGENVDEIAIVIVDGTKKLAADSGYIA